MLAVTRGRRMAYVFLEVDLEPGLERDTVDEVDDEVVSGCPGRLWLRFFGCGGGITCVRSSGSISVVLTLNAPRLDQVAVRSYITHRYDLRGLCCLRLTCQPACTRAFAGKHSSSVPACNQSDDVRRTVCSTTWVGGTSPRNPSPSPFQARRRTRTPMHAHRSLHVRLYV